MQAVEQLDVEKRALNTIVSPSSPESTARKAYRSSGGAAAVRRARAGAAEDVDGAAEQAEQAVAAHGLLVAVLAGRLRVVGARDQEVDVLGRREGRGGHGEGQEGGEVGELHFGGWWVGWFGVDDGLGRWVWVVELGEWTGCSGCWMMMERELSRRGRR